LKNLLNDFGVDPIEDLDKQYDEDEVVNYSLEIKKVGVAAESIEPSDPHEKCVQR
jgi:hypothetical protein